MRRSPVLLGLRLRCPACGSAPLYRTFFEAHDRCAACGRRHAADRGDWTGGAEITLLVTSASLILLFLALRAWTALTPRATLAVLAVAAVVLVPLVYRRVKGLWTGLVYAWEGDAPRPSPVRDPEWFTALWDAELDRPTEEPPSLSFRW